jgi:hypothetical protein
LIGDGKMSEGLVITKKASVDFLRNIGYEVVVEFDNYRIIPNGKTKYVNLAIYMQNKLSIVTIASKYDYCEALEYQKEFNHCIEVMRMIEHIELNEKVSTGD